MYKLEFNVYITQVWKCSLCESIALVLTLKIGQIYTVPRKLSCFSQGGTSETWQISKRLNIKLSLSIGNEGNPYQTKILKKIWDGKKLGYKS